MICSRTFAPIFMLASTAVKNSRDSPPTQRFASHDMCRVHSRSHIVFVVCNHGVAFQISLASLEKVWHNSRPTCIILRDRLRVDGTSATTFHVGYMKNLFGNFLNRVYVKIFPWHLSPPLITPARLLSFICSAMRKIHHKRTDPACQSMDRRREQFQGGMDPRECRRSCFGHEARPRRAANGGGGSSLRSVVEVTISHSWLAPLSNVEFVEFRGSCGGWRRHFRLQSIWSSWHTLTHEQVTVGGGSGQRRSETQFRMTDSKMRRVLSELVDICGVCGR